MKREIENMIRHKEAETKSKMIEHVIEANVMQEEARKTMIENRMKHEEERKREKDHEEELKHMQKMEEERNKERYREEVRSQMVKQDEGRREMIMNNIRLTDNKLKSVQDRHMHELMIKNELQNQKRQDRMEAAERVQRLKEHEREIMLERIKAEDLRLQKLMNEK